MKPKKLRKTTTKKRNNKNSKYGKAEEEFAERLAEILIIQIESERKRKEGESKN